jgi:hypothetical protein
MDIVQEIVTPNPSDSISYPIKGFSDRLLARLRGFEGWNRLGGAKKAAFGQKSSRHGGLLLAGGGGDPGRRLGGQLEFQPRQKQLQVGLWLGVT